MKRTSGFVALLSVLVLVAGACGDGESDDQTPDGAGGEPSLSSRTIGYVAVVGNDGIETRFGDNFERAVEFLGWNPLYSDAGGDLQAGIAAVDGYINQGVDAIITLVWDPTLLQEQFAAAEERGIPILLCCADTEAAGPDSLDYAARYVPDERRLGELMGEAFASDFPDESATFGYIDSSQTFVGRERQEGFIDEAEAAGNELIGSAPVDIANAFESSDQAALALVQGNPEMDGAYAPFDFSGVSLAKAKTQVGSDVTVYGAFADAANYPAMEEGTLEVVAEVDAVATLMVTLDQLIRHFEEGADFDPNALDGVDLHYEVIRADENLPPTDQGPHTEETVQAWFDKWAEEYGVGGS